MTEHKWSKQNLVTLHGKDGLHDKMKCEVCGITAKRFGVQWPPTRDKRYQDEVYADCDTARDALDPVKRMALKKEKKKARRLARKLKKAEAARHG